MAEDVEEPEWGPLQRVADVWNGAGHRPAIVVADFMYMWRFESPKRSTIHLYKHILSRRYLNLDDAGHAFRFMGESKAERLQVRGGNIYRLHRDLATAVRHLQLDQVYLPAP
jgi:hypothetical protein